MLTAVTPKKPLTDEEMVLLARFRMLPTSSRSFITETMWSLNQREARDAAKGPELRLVVSKKEEQN